ncbi:MAG TPA: hypothetical protein VN900_16575 [Stellaceae bacterium]|jgi:hypothetical protein|nr:hypothetical protein [Stellaceae bacterium]
MAAIEDIVGWCRQELSRLAHRLEQLQSGHLRTYEKHPHSPGWLEIDTTAQSIELCRQYMSEFNAIIARHPEVAPPAPSAPPPAPARVVHPAPHPAAAHGVHVSGFKDTTHPGWVNGWAVVKGQPPKWQVIGIYESHAEAVEAAAEAGEGYYARWGGYNTQTKDFTSGPAMTG